MKTTSFKIISTLGQASLNQEFLKFCERFSQSYFRLNGSYLTVSEIQKYIKVIQKYTSAENPELYLDLQGNKLRIGQLKQELRLTAGKMITLKLESHSSTREIPIPHPQIFEQVEAGEHLYLQDAAIKLQITEVKNCSFVAKILEGGRLRSRAGINIPAWNLSIYQPDTMQTEQIKQSQFLGIRNLALSYIKCEHDLQTLKELCQNIGYFPRLIAKIERPDSLRQLDKICQIADEIWFCRGDLGSLIPLKELGHWQTFTIKMAIEWGIPVMVAGQVFHHLTEHTQPTRSEVVHLWTLREQGVSGIILSDETVIGKNPLRAIAEIFRLL